MATNYYYPNFYGGVIRDSSSVYSYIDFEEIFKSKLVPSECSMISWNITNKCDFNCFYCLNFDHKEKKDLKLNNVIDAIKKNKPNKVVITGGEPTLESNLVNIVTKLYKYVNEVEIISNGSNLNLLLALPKKTKIRISIDSLNNNYFKKVSNYLSIDDILNNIFELKKNGFNLGINTVYTKYNENDIYNLFKILKNKNINDFFISYVFPRGHAIKNYKSMKGNMQNYVKLIKKLYINKFNINLLIDYNVNYFIPRYGSCSYKNIPHMLYLDRSGKIFYCDQFNNNKNMKYLRKINMMDLDDECSQCKFRWFCNGGCRANAFFLDKSVYKKDTVACELFKVWYKVWSKENNSITSIIDKFNFPKIFNYNFINFKKYLFKHFEGNIKNLKATINFLDSKDIDVLFYSLWQDILFESEFYLFDILESNINYFLKNKKYTAVCKQLLFFWLGEQFLYSSLGELIGNYLSKNNILFCNKKLTKNDEYLKLLFLKLNNNRKNIKSKIINNKKLNLFLVKNIYILKKGFVIGLIDYVKRNS